MPTKRKKHSTTKQIEQAIELLIQTDMSYQDISKKTGVSTSKVSTLGVKYRSEEKRQRLILEGRARGHRANAKKTLERNQVETEVLPTPTPAFHESSIEELLGKEGIIKRNVSFKYSSAGRDVKMDEFIDELQSLIITLEESGNVLVDFSFTVQAE